MAFPIYRAIEMLDGVSKLAKLLASDELKTRRKGHKYVQELLRLKPGPDSYKISYKDVLGICKGLYYSLWMQDKPLLQEEIESKIVRLISTISTVEIRSMYIIAMFETLAREWDNLDVWRTDKFMMLTRDFFVRTLLCSKNLKIPVTTLTEAVFGKVLNNNANSAVDLKIFLAMVVQQELLKHKQIPEIILNFFRRSVDVIVSIPRGSVYSTDMIKLLLFLTRTLRTYPSVQLSNLSEEMLNASTTNLEHRKTLRRIAEMLYVKQKASGAKPENSLENEEKPTARKRKLSEEDADDGEQKIDRVESSYVGLKKQKLEINGTPVKSPAAPTAEKSQGSAEGTPKRKRRRSGVDSPSVTGGDDSQSATPENGNKVKRRRSSSGSGDVTTEDAIASKSPKRAKRVEGTTLVMRPATEESVTIAPEETQSLHHAEDKESPILKSLKQPLDDSFNDLRGTPVQIAVPMVAQSTGGKHGCTNGNIADGETESNACFDLSVLDHAPAEFKKRVSFGKIFRKKFSSSKELVITPTTKSKPEKGILRQ